MSKRGTGWRVVCGFGMLMLTCTTGFPQALTNLGFEAGNMTGWETFGSGWRISSFSNDAGSDAHSGAAGAVNDVMKDDKDEWRGILQSMPASYGMLCSASVWIRTLKAKNSEALLELQFTDKDKKVLAIKQSEPVSGNDPYTQVEVDRLEAPKKTEWLLVRGIVHMTSPPGKDNNFIMFDDFEVIVTNKNKHAKSDDDGGRKKMTPEERIKSRMKSRAL